MAYFERVVDFFFDGALFSDWLLGRVLGAAGSAVRAVVAEERSRSALDGCAHRALASAVARQHKDLGEDQVEAMESGLAELLWCNGDSIPLADQQTSLWRRFRAGVAASFSVLNRTQTDEGITQAEAMGLDPALLAEDFVDAFYRQLEAAAVKPGTGGDSLKVLVAHALRDRRPGPGDPPARRRGPRRGQ